MEQETGDRISPCPLDAIKTTCLFDAIKLPKEVAVIHCQGHQRDDSDITEGSRRADQQAKEAATQPFNIQAPLLWGKFPTDIKPQYSPKECHHSLSCGDTLLCSGWLQAEDGIRDVHL